jgi:hypothetical protein
MISERDLAEKFTVIWKQNFPLLNSGFIRLFNETQITQVNSKIVENSENVRYDLISELGFNLSEIVHCNGLPLNDYINNEIQLNCLIEKTMRSIWSPEVCLEANLKLTDSELHDTIKISENIIEFINKSKSETINFRPKLKGYGFIPDLEADLLIGDTLYEIKTVKRNFMSSDIKQLFIYLALQQVSKDENFINAGLYNPRKGNFAKFNIKKLVYNLSGGKTPNEVFEDLLNGFVRDIEIDSKF